jgi:superfamily II DNA or RNA helicase
LKVFPANITFKYPWRNYQKRVLDELEEHLEDNHLHVIAPPGSGKTVLGLEVMLRLNKPTLVLTPTIAIRNQWVARFCELFLQVEQSPEWVSKSIKKPGFITVITYQGLHAACSGGGIIEEEFEELETQGEEVLDPIKNDKLQSVIDALESIELGTIVVDEAHHLKNEWWKTLIQIKNKLEPTIVGLTATPPYDVTYLEWSRYIELNGPVDTEISVPELVKEGDLCPHQDYVLVSEPSEEELLHIKEYRSTVNGLFIQLSNDNIIVDEIFQSSIIQQPESHLEWIYSNMEDYSSILVFLHHNAAELDKYHFKITGNDKSKLPKLNHAWFEVFAEYYINRFQAVDETHQKFVASLLRKNGALERGKVKLSEDSKLDRYLTASLGKLESIKKITAFESSILNNELRQVILSDFIRKEYLSDTIAINKLGVIPIFETLRRDTTIDLKIGVLTGSLIIIPKTALSKLIESAKSFGITTIGSKPLDYDTNYLIINVSSNLKGDIVHIVTKTFESGEINLLVGTKSLLGEGWDAPSINTLILASFVGSFVLSNQMRGRAIRTVRSDHHKTGNIWHLVCHDPTNPEGGKDVDLLSRRFKGFVGISERENRTIENGFTRLEMPKPLNKINIEAFNNAMFSSASERGILRNQWYQAIENGISLVEEIKIPYQEEIQYQKQKKLYLNKTIAYMLTELVIGITFYAQEFLGELHRLRNLFRTPEGRFTILGLFFGGAFLFFGGHLYKAMKMFIRYKDISKDIEAIGNCLLTTLIETKQIHTDTTKLEIKTTVNDYGEIFCHLEGGTTFEKNMFIKSLQEIVNPVNNPRYIIIRKGLLFNFLQQNDYHQVPEVLGKHKRTAVSLFNHWRNLVGNAALVFTRNPEGRTVLLKARFNSLASEFQEKAERTNRWK